MAFSTYVIDPSDSSRGADRCNVDWSVGRLGVNMREDVMLVQALLDIFYWKLHGLTEPTLTPPPEDQGIEVDGYMGPITQRHITRFQQQCKARGYDVWQDGLFDPFRRAGDLSTRTRTRYAIELLNNACQKYCTAHNATYYGDLFNGQNPYPLLLRNALRTRKDTANQYRHH